LCLSRWESYFRAFRLHLVFSSRISCTSSSTPLCGRSSKSVANRPTTSADRHCIRMIRCVLCFGLWDTGFYFFLFPGQTVPQGQPIYHAW
jgi:hypothetical protein